MNINFLVKTVSVSNVSTNTGVATNEPRPNFKALAFEKSQFLIDNRWRHSEQKKHYQLLTLGTIMSRISFLLAIAILLATSAACRRNNKPANQKVPVQEKATTTDQSGKSVGLILAAATGDTGKVKVLLDSGADANVKGGDGRTPLMEAAYAGHTEIARLLLDKGANIDLKKTDGATAISFARGRNDKALIEMFDQVNQLLAASAKGDVNAVKELLDKGASVNARGDKNRTALMEAAYGGHTEVVRLLLDKGADVTPQKDDGATALSLTQASSHKEIVEMLTQKGAK
jgi:ankyrin repeat protein